VAASKCRAKKKGRENQLQEDIRMAQATNTLLRTQHAGLLSEVEGLEDMVSLCNAECNRNRSPEENIERIQGHFSRGELKEQLCFLPTI